MKANFKKGDRVCLAYFLVPEVARLRIKLGLPIYYLGTFERYRSEQERAEWRAEDDCWAFFDKVGRKCYPSSLLLAVTPEQEHVLEHHVTRLAENEHRASSISS